MFSEHVMCALFCVMLRAARVEKKKLVVTMDSQAACAARALRQPRPRPCQLQANHGRQSARSRHDAGLQWDSPRA